MKNPFVFPVSKSLFLTFFIIIGGEAISANASYIKRSVIENTISGVVYDNKRTPLSDVEVELLDDLSRFVSRNRTDSSGRYFFSGMPQGRYKIRAIPLLVDFEEGTIDVELVTFKLSQSAASSSDNVVQDIYLRPRKGGLNDTTITGTVFIQNIPKDAEKLYDKAIEDLKKKRIEQGIKGLQDSLHIFPNYYLALEQLGSEFFKLRQYDVAAQAFLKAGEVNPKSATTYYMLGYCFYQLKNYKAAGIALRQAQFIAPSSVKVLLILGTTLRLNGEYGESEKYLKQGKKLANGGLPDINLQLALLYGNNLKRYKEAAEELEIYLKARPDTQDSKFMKELIKKFKEKATQS